ncbi:MAG: protease modulator HflC [Gemmataceae bacterium]|nr:protease modulator HflC [Gemmataceae bacterium]
MKTFALILAIPIGLWFFSQALFTVDRAEFAYLTRFGAHVATFDGADPSQAGLHFKLPWPIQAVRKLDSRLQFFDLPSVELLTRDPQRNTIDKTLTLDAFICWQISDAKGVDTFLRTVGSMEGARAILSQRVNSELGAIVGTMELDDLVSVEEGKVERKRVELRNRLLGAGPEGKSFQATTLAEYGIRVVDIRLRRANHPPAVRQAIFDRIISERDRKAAEYQAEGEKKAADIRSASESKVARLRSQSEATAAQLKGLAEAEADRIRSLAQARDPAFYSFLKKLEEYQRILGDNKTTLFLGTQGELFDLLFRPPGAPGKNP